MGEWLHSTPTRKELMVYNEEMGGGYQDLACKYWKMRKADGE